MQTHLSSPLSVEDKPSKVLNVLSFVCPPVGLVVYLSLVGKMPRQALSAGLSAAKGVATLLAFVLLFAFGAFVMWFADDVLHLFPAPQEVTVTAKPPIQPPVPNN